MLRLAVLFSLTANIASAGAWPRDEGAWFLAIATELGGFNDLGHVSDVTVYNSFYAEYGLTASLTLGLHGGYGPAAELDTRLFFRLPVLQHDVHKLALELSVGQVDELNYSGIGLHYGRGITLGETSGWLSVETRIDHVFDNQKMEVRQTKLDLTVGLTHKSGIQSMVQIFNTEIDDTLYSTLATGLVFPISDDFSVDTGVLFDLQNDRSPGIRIGFWHNF